jgi:hypothetical protein
MVGPLLTFLTIARSSTAVIPGRAERREPGIQTHQDSLPNWIPGSLHNASQTRVNRLMRERPGMTGEFTP